MPWDRRTASSRATGSALGKRLRKAALERDGRQCTRLVDGTRCTRLAEQVDHVVPVHKGGALALSNMASLCLPHHKEKIAEEAAAARPRERREAERHPGLIDP